jgi:protein transport protein SEC61 subunit gamma-like protein
MDIVEKSWEIQKGIEDRAKRLGKGRYGRVLKMARKPTNDEFVKTVMITGLGLVLIGGLGFAIYLLVKYLPGMLGL